MVRLGFCCLMLLWIGNLKAQLPAFQLPKIDDEWVYAPTLGPDPEAEAVMLLDYGEVNFGATGGRIRLYYTYYREIKILKEEGVRWATVTVPLNEEEDLFDVRGFTYTVLEETGKVQKLKMERRAVREEVLEDGRTVKVFKLPLPRKGSVLAYAYTVSSTDFSSLRHWDFQSSIPVMISEFVARIPDGFSYLTLFQGNASRLEQESSHYPINMRLRIAPTQSGIPKVFASIHEDPELRLVTETHYRMTQLPAWKEEPFMVPEVDQVTRIQFKLAKIGRTKRSTYDILQNWSAVNEKLMAQKDFGQRLGEVIEWPQSWKSLLAQNNRSREHLFALFEAVRTTIKWNGDYDIYAPRPLAQVVQSRQGNSAEVNLLLTALLQAAEYRVHPILISTRSNGQSIPLYPQEDQFNHVLVQVELKGQKIYLDATQVLGPPDLVPLESLVMEGLRVNHKRPGWVEIESPYTRYRRSYSRVFLLPDGNLKGKLSHYDKGYNAVRTREILNRYPDKNQFFREIFLSGFEEVKMGPTTIKGLDQPSEPLATRSEFQTSDYVTSTEELILLRPLLSEAYETNPFPNEPRQSPIDFQAPISEQYVMVLTLPEGYRFEVVPEDITVTLPNRAAVFMYKTKIINQHIQLLSRIRINQPIFSPEQYDQVRLFFQHIASKHGERIIVKRVEDQ